MKLLGIRRFGKRHESPWQVKALAVDVSGWAGSELVVSGVLDYVQDGEQRSIRLTMTPATLQIFDVELQRVGKSVAQRLLVSQVMKHWGWERLELLAQTGHMAPKEGLFLEFATSAPGAEAQRLLELSGLIRTRRI